MVLLTNYDHFPLQKNCNCLHLEKFLSSSTLKKKKILTIFPWEILIILYLREKKWSSYLWENSDRPFVAYLGACWRLPYKLCHFKESSMRLLFVRDAAQTRCMVTSCNCDWWTRTSPMVCYDAFELVVPFLGVWCKLYGPEGGCEETHNRV